MKQHKLVWRQAQEQAGRGKYRRVELVLPADHEILPVREGPKAPYLTVNVGLEIEAPPGSEFLLPTFISPGQRKLLWATLCAGVCAGMIFGMGLLLLGQGLSGSDLDDAALADEVLTLPSNASGNCTLTYDPDDISELMREAYVRTFFNVTCLATNGTGDPCDLHLAEEYTHRMFSALRFHRLVAEFLAFVAIFSLAQVGGIPRPTDRNGMFFWLAWMATQLAQYVVILCALILQVFSFLGVRARLSPCLVQVDGTALLDFYAMCTFAAQPLLLVKAAMLFVYAFLLSLGMLVFDGSRQWPWRRVRIADKNWSRTILLVAYVKRLHRRAQSRIAERNADVQNANTRWSRVILPMAFVTRLRVRSRNMAAPDSLTAHALKLDTSTACCTPDNAEVTENNFTVAPEDNFTVALTLTRWSCLQA